jgi:two-component system phosphate regulon sensor histidine kinase PhoR
MTKRQKDLWFNDAARNLLDFKPTQDIGQRIDNLIRHPTFAAFLARGGLGHLDIPSPRDHLITISIRIIPYGDEQRLLIARDISERQRLEQMRRDFVGNVSHELRTPLTVVAGFLENMVDTDEACANQWGKSLQLMRQQTIRMQSLVEDLLLLSRLENDSYQPSREVVEVCAMVAAMCDDARLLSGEKNQVIDLECDEELALYGAEQELYSAFNNLVTNAVRYTPAGGRIRIRWYSDESGAHFAVVDSGMGIAEENIPRVTERFYRVDPGRSRESGGTGLGLAIVKHVMQRHDAKLNIQSRVGRGSTFSCDFPHARVTRVENSCSEQENHKA